MRLPVSSLVLTLLIVACGAPPTTPAPAVPTSTPVPPSATAGQEVSATAPTAPSPTPTGAATEAGTPGALAVDFTNGTWAEGAPMLTPRSEMPAAALDGQLYVPGGFGGETTFEAYDPGSDTWRALAPLPAGRHHLMAAAHPPTGRVYVFGGAAAGGWQPTATAWAYDPDSDTWSELSAMPEARLAGAAVSLGDYLYVVGGTGGTSALLRYDPAANSWTSLAALNQPREHTAAVALDGKIYALAGRWGGVGELNSVESYDPASDAWSPGPGMQTPRGGLGAAVGQNQIVVVGGEVIMTGSETLASVEVLDLSAGTWSPGPPLPVPLHGVPVVAIGDRLFVLGGSDRAGAVENRGRTLIFSTSSQ